MRLVDLRPDLLLLGWRGTPGQQRYLLGSTLDPVTRYAPCDVAVMRTGDLDAVHRVLVPMSSGPNAPLALELALRLPDVQVTALNVARESLGPTGEAVGHAQLNNVLRPWAGNDRVSAKVVGASGIIDGILAEAASGYDMVLIGATKASYVDRKLFGNVPQAVAADAPVPTVVVQRHAGAVKTLLRRAEWRVSQIEDSLTTRRARRDVSESARWRARPTGLFRPDRPCRGGRHAGAADEQPGSDHWRDGHCAAHVVHSRDQPGRGAWRHALVLGCSPHAVVGDVPGDPRRRVVEPGRARQRTDRRDPGPHAAHAARSGCGLGSRGRGRVCAVSQRGSGRIARSGHRGRVGSPLATVGIGIAMLNDKLHSARFCCFSPT